MPNWVHHRLIATGDPDEIERLRAINHVLGEQGRVSEFSFWGLLPVPDEVEARGYDSGPTYGVKYSNGKRLPSKPGQTLSGYEWRIEFWGTKWDASDVWVKAEYDKLEYGFQTAWSTPMPWVKALAKEFPKLRIDMYSIEEQPSFAIHYILNDGEIKERAYLNREEKVSDLSIGEIKSALELFSHGPIDRGLEYIPMAWEDSQISQLVIRRMKNDEYTAANVLISFGMSDRIKVINRLMEDEANFLERTLADHETYERKATSIFELLEGAPAEFRKKLGAFAIRAKERGVRTFGIALLGTFYDPSQEAGEGLALEPGKEMDQNPVNNLNNIPKRLYKY